jgi:cytochrome P450
MSAETGAHHGLPTRGMDLRESPLDEIIRDPARRDDPWTLYREIREEHPIYAFPEWGSFLLTRWDDCERVLRDPKFSSDMSRRILPEGVEPMDGGLMDTAGNPDFKTLLFLDPPDHTRIRGLVSKAFTPRTVEQLRPHIQEITDAVLDEAAECGELDVVNTLGYRVPSTVICELMGVPLADRDQFGPWAADASRVLDAETLSEAELERSLFGVMNLLNYFNFLFEERRAAPGDDLVSALLAAEEAGDTLSDVELRSIVLLLFVAGFETTMNLIGNGTWALLRNPDQLRQLREDPSLIGQCTEELLRFDGPVHLTGRVASEDLEIGDGVLVRKGEQVTTLVSAANRDPARFDHPDELDITRPDPRHLTFSHGIHYCLGAALARVEGQTAIGSLVSRFESIEPLEAPTYRDHFVLRGLNSLRVAVS